MTELYSPEPKVGTSVPSWHPARLMYTLARFPRTSSLLQALAELGVLRTSITEAAAEAEAFARQQRMDVESMKRSMSQANIQPGAAGTASVSGEGPSYIYIR